MFQDDISAAKQRIHDLQEESKQYQLARQFKSTKKKTVKAAWRVFLMSFRWWR
jgi:hypothetical protein